MRTWVRYLPGLLFLCLLVLAAERAASEPPGDLRYQGLLRDASGSPLTGVVDIELGVWDAFAGGNRLYREFHNNVELREGVFELTIGAGDFREGAFDAALFTEANRFLEVIVEGETLAPRQPFNSVAYALQSTVSQLALDADTLDGLDATALDQSAHAADTSNPHGVTAAQVGAATPAEVGQALSAHAADASAHHEKTALFAELRDQASDAQVPESVARDAEVFPLVLSADGAGSGLDADRLDGFEASDFVAEGTDRWVDESGDTMTGPLVVQGDVQTNGSYRYASRRTRFFTVSGAAFDPGSAPHLDKWNRTFFAGYGLAVASGVGLVSLGAPVHLPDGARIESMECSFYDTEPNADVELFIRLNRHSLSSRSGEQQLIVQIDLPGYTQNESDIVILTPTKITSSLDLLTVDNANHSYDITVMWNESGTKDNFFGIRWYGCRVAYSVDRVPF